MKAWEWRYLAVALTLSAGAFLVLALLVHVWVGIAYLAAFYVAFMRYSWLNSAIERIVNGKEKKT